MSHQPRLAHYYPDAPIAGAPAWGSVPGMLGQVRDRPETVAAGNWAGLIDSLRAEGVLRYVAHQLLAAGVEVPGPVRDLFRKEVVLGEAEKMSDDRELGRIFAAAKHAGLPILLIKGEAVARTLYPTAACRPTGDCDLLIRPADIRASQSLFADLGYRPGALAGEHIFAAQAWHQGPEVRGRAHPVDLHWDITHRRFLRQRTDLDELFERSKVLVLEDGEVRVPGTAHLLLIACVHLGAADPGLPVDLRWLLDIALALDALGLDEFDALAERARRWRLLDVLAVYCDIANRVLGPCRHAAPVGRLAARVSGARRRIYKWTCDHRWFDLLEYGLRLQGLADRRDFTTQILAYRKVRRNLAR